MTFNLTVKFPKQEEYNQNQEKTTNIKETFNNLSQEELIEIYNSFERQGYEIKVDFTETTKDFDVFKTAEDFLMNDIDYKATLKFKNKSNTGSYEDIKNLAKIFDRHGFSYDINIKLKINENSEIDFTKEDTWFGLTPIYTLSPKVKVTDINDIKMLYTELSELSNVEIKIKPKKTESKNFALELSNYPENSEITFTLQDKIF